MKRHVLIALFCGIPAAACQSAGERPAAELSAPIEFKVAGMICKMCPPTVEAALKRIPGVLEAAADYPSLQARVVGDARVTREKIREAVASAGFEARFPGEAVPESSQPLAAQEAENLDMRTISHGEAVDVKAHLAPGKITIFDYYADWCGPCKLLSPKLEHLVKEAKNLALRKIDIKNWNSDAAKQATDEFHMPGLPYVRVYDAKGALLGEFEGNHFEKLEEILKGKVQK